MKRISIIIVHYDDLTSTIKCLRTIPKVFLPNVIIVNNSSKCIFDDINRHFKVKNIFSIKNLGYANALNFGIKKAIKNSCEYIFCCNNDILFPNNFFQKMIFELENRGLQIISPQIYKPDKTPWFLGGKINQIRFSGDHQKGCLDYLTGCCLLFRASVFKSIGLFDEKYFMYYEDVDYFLRCKKNNVRFGISKSIKIVHNSKSINSKLASYFLEKNRLKILFKYANFYVKFREVVRLPKTIYEHFISKNHERNKAIFDYIFHLVIIILIIFNSNNAYAEYRFNSSNPLLIGEEIYESRGVFSPSIVSKDGTLFMWYTSENDEKRTISVATSLDGISWTRYANNPIIFPDTSNQIICEKNVHDPEVIYNQVLSKFQMWYAVNCEPASTGVPRYWIKYAESNDGYNWTPRQSPVLSPLAAWEIEGIANITVWQDNYLYKMIYIGRNTSGQWKFGYAESFDGLSWTKSPDNPTFYPTKSWELDNIGSPDIIKWNSVYDLYYHTATFSENQYIAYATSLDGMNWIKPEDNPLFILPSEESSPIGPEVIYIDDKRRLYYSSVRNGRYSISLYEEYSTSPTPTLTPTPTPIPTPIPTAIPTLIPTSIPTPTPSNALKVIFVPGLFGSWNKEAILHNKKSEQKDWIINPIINEHKGIIETFKKLGYVENTNFYVFAYDWRKSIESIADDLNTYINSKTLQGEKVKILSYSLGGLVSRIYSQKYSLAKIDTLLTVASPHHGTSKVYKPVEAGEIDQDNSWEWMAEKTILSLNRSYFDSDKKTIEKVFPVLQNLLPVYNYIEKDTGGFINYQDMIMKNTYLDNYNKIFTPNTNFKSFSGEKVNTSFGYVVAPQSVSDKLIDIYPDGRPISETKMMGDYILTGQTEDIGNNIKTPYDHGEIIYKKDALKNILNALNISYIDDQIVEGAGTRLDKSIMVLIKSPATMELSLGNTKYLENEGMIFVENAEEGEYQLKIIGNDYGDYTAIVGKNYPDKSEWTEFKGLINTDPPSSQIDNYLINYQSIVSISPSPSPVLTLDVITGPSNNSNLSQSVNTPICDKKKPTAMPRLISAISGDESVTLVWEKYLDENFDHFVIAYGTNPGKYDFGVPYVSDKNSTVYLISELNNDQKYYFVIKAVNDCAPGEFSNELSTTPNIYEIKSYTDPEESVLGIASEESEISISVDEKPEVSPIPIIENKEDDRKVMILFSVFIMLSGGFVIYSITSKIRDSS